MNAAPTESSLDNPGTSRHPSAGIRWAPPNEAARLLAERGSHREIGRALGVVHGTVGLWLRGSATPSRATRERIAATFNIQPELWERRAEPLVGEPRGATTPATGSEPVAVNAHARLRDQLARIDKQRAEGGLSPRTALDLEKVELGINRELSKSDGSELTEEQVCALPVMRALATRISNELFRRAPLTGFELLDALSGSDRASHVRASHPELCAAIDNANRALAEALEAAQEARPRV